MDTLTELAQCWRMRAKLQTQGEVEGRWRRYPAAVLRQQTMGTNQPSPSAPLAGSTSTIGLWGRSMGAVTALLYSQRDPSVAGMVSASGAGAVRLRAYFQQLWSTHCWIQLCRWCFLPLAPGAALPPSWPLRFVLRG